MLDITINSLRRQYICKKEYNLLPLQKKLDMNGVTKTFSYNAGSKINSPFFPFDQAN